MLYFLNIANRRGIGYPNTRVIKMMILLLYHGKIINEAICNVKLPRNDWLFSTILILSPDALNLIAYEARSNVNSIYKKLRYGMCK